MICILTFNVANRKCALFRRIRKIGHSFWSFKWNTISSQMFLFINILLSWALVSSALIFNGSLLHTLSQCQQFTYTLFACLLSLLSSLQHLHSHITCVSTPTYSHTHITHTRHGFRCGTCIYINYTRILVHTENFDGKLTKIGLLPCISTIELTMLNFDYAICWKSTKFSSTLIA